jgi:hypothetical protein
VPFLDSGSALLTRSQPHIGSVAAIGTVCTPRNDNDYNQSSNDKPKVVVRRHDAALDCYFGAKLSSPLSLLPLANGTKELLIRIDCWSFSIAFPAS